MSGRGNITEEIKKKSKELLGYEVSTIEYRLMPYIQYVMVNEQRLDIKRISPDEREILSKWRKAGHVEGGASGLSITKEFWDIICSLIFLGYVASCPRR